MKGHALHNYFEKKNSNRIHGILWRWRSRPQHQQRKSAVRMQTAAAGPSNRNKPFRVDVRDSLEGTDSPGRLRRSRSKRSFGIFRIEKMSEKGFAGSSRTIIGGNKSIGMSESPATI
jgi:hypothetical protein